MKRVGLILKQGKPEATALAREIVGWLGESERTAVVLDEIAADVPGATAVSEGEFGAACELLVTLGGDGTLLYGASLVSDRDVPVLGVNLGRLGFLTAAGPSATRAALERALAGGLPVEERTRIQVELARASGERVSRAVVNDAVISQAAMARLIELDAYLDGALITTYRADGLIVSTPTGSTAYNLAAGGPILAPGLASMVLTPICPHTLTNRPLVVPADAKVEVRVAGDAAHVMLTLDGQWARPFLRGDRVTLTRAPKPMRLLRDPASGYFDILRSKLRWGERETGG